MRIEAIACDLCGQPLKDNEETQVFQMGEYTADEVCPKCAEKIVKTAQGLSPEARAARAAKRKAASEKKK